MYFRNAVAVLSVFFFHNNNNNKQYVMIWKARNPNLIEGSESCTHKKVYMGMCYDKIEKVRI